MTTPHEIDLANVVHYFMNTRDWDDENVNILKMKIIQVMK